MQLIIVIILVAACLAYAVWRIMCAFRAAKNPAGGCPGCPLSKVCGKHTKEE